MRRLIIHAGIQRTGTTSLQRLLSANRDRLAAKGITYPGEEENHQSWAWDLQKRLLTGEAVRDSLRRLAGDTILLSAEAFCVHRDLAWLDALVRDFHIQVFFTLRRQDDWLMSWYNQNVSRAFDPRKARMRPEDFLATVPEYHWLDYAELGRRWADRIGVSNVKMEPLSHDSVRCFVRHVLPEVGDISAPSKENASLSPLALEVVRHLEPALLSREQKKRLALALIEILPGRGSIYSAEIRRSILDRFRKSNADAARRFAGRPDGELFSEEIDSEAHIEARLPDSSRLLERVIAPLLRRLL